MTRFISAGFRPFFLGAALFAAAGIPAWVAIYAAGRADALALGYEWHAHEMVFGYTLAVFAGFLTICSRALARGAAVHLVGRRASGARHAGRGRVSRCSATQRVRVRRKDPHQRAKDDQRAGRGRAGSGGALA